MKTVTVEVKQKHIKKGTRVSCDTCPVALAIIDCGIRDAAVTTGGITLWPTKSLDFVDVATPRSVSKFIVRFDGHKPVKPFSFRLRYDI